MSPYSTVAPSEEHIEQIEVGQRAPVAEPPRRPMPERPEEPKPLLAPRGKNWFNEALLEMSTTRPPRRTLDFVIAFSFEITVIVVLILLPLMFTDAIDLRQLTATYLVAPPPPPPPPPPPAQGIVRASKAPARVFSQGGHLIAPSAVPKQIAMLKEEALPPEVGGTGGVEGGVPGGVPGGQMGGVLGGVLGGILQQGAKPPAPSTVGTRANPARVGGNVKAPVPIFNPQPAYPVLAKQAKISGSVNISAIIDAEGNVVEMKAVSGHPLLIHTALEAVSKWKYRPTVLNGEPIAVELIVTVNFRLQ